MTNPADYSRCSFVKPTSIATFNSLRHRHIWHRPHPIYAIGHTFSLDGGVGPAWGIITNEAAQHSFPYWQGQITCTCGDVAELVDGRLAWAV